MKKLLLLFIFLLSGIIMQAQTADKKWAVGLGAGLYHGNTLKGTGFIPELYLSRYISPSFDLMLNQNLGMFNSKNDYDLDFSGTFLNMRYKLNNNYILSEEASVRPYVFGGPGYLLDNEIGVLTFDAGLGFKFPLSESVSLFVEGGYIDGIGKSKAEDEGTYPESFIKGVGGIEICFGKAKDSDLDGVPDKKDECPDTPAGVTVDEKGCPVDRDGDGIADYKDDCPDEAGSELLNGCPDKDGDGIADKDDKCPDVAGLKKFDGCPDSDEDGVIDSKDECPDTPKGYKVDEKGCPLDRDGDGIVDEEDECPDEPGTIEDKGCPKKETFSKVDEGIEPLYFYTDKSSLSSNTIKKLGKLIKVLNDNSNYFVKIYGHADERASEEYNMTLSEKRAKSVQDYLVNHGIAAERIMEVKGFGESKPAEKGGSVDKLQKNRRVELELYKKE